MPTSKEVAKQTQAEILKDNTFGILTDTELSEDDKVKRLIALIPVALEIEQEARATIERLNNEIEELKKND